ncbi:MAG: hypothetical protein IPL35_15420 [Sphingobacteriales bacterium]|nr:hypothetical protein [Sphingobacteriales bacterium]
MAGFVAYIIIFCIVIVGFSLQDCEVAVREIYHKPHNSDVINLKVLYPAFPDTTYSTQYYVFPQYIDTSAIEDVLNYPKMDTAIILLLRSHRSFHVNTVWVSLSDFNTNTKKTACIESVIKKKCLFSYSVYYENGYPHIEKKEYVPESIKLIMLRKHTRKN